MSKRARKPRAPRQSCGRHGGPTPAHKPARTGHEAEVMVADCCGCGGGKALLRIDGVWFLFVKASDGMVMSNGPVHTCPHCGCPLDEQGADDLALRMATLLKQPVQPEEMPLAPARLYRWRGEWDAHLTQVMGAVAPPRTQPFKISKPAQETVTGPPDESIGINQPGASNPLTV